MFEIQTTWLSANENVVKDVIGDYLKSRGPLSSPLK
jgi:hypothetical protein